ncbi:MAG: hypothetical protein HC806_02505 [Anaerolineae bacterium]|nr:hypothetical protein [Anaerolineae bacterium]
MKAIEINTYLQSLRSIGPYPHPDVDTFKMGDPHAEIRGIAVGWMSYTWALQKAIELGCNFIYYIMNQPFSTIWTTTVKFSSYLVRPQNSI